MIPHETPSEPSADRAVAVSDRPAYTPRSGGQSRRLMAFIEVVVCSGFPTQLALAVLLGTMGLGAFNRESGLSFGYVITLSLADTILLIGLIFYFLRVHRESICELVLGKRSTRGEVSLGLLLIPVMVLVAVAGLTVIHWIAPSLRNVPENPLEALLSTPARAVAFALVAIVAGGLREELQRAFILRRFEQHLGGGWFGLVVFSVAFGFGHQIQGWDAAIITGSLGAIWGALYLVRRNIVASVISHAGFNVTEIALALSTQNPAN